MIRFVMVLLCAFGVVSAASLAWPRLTSQPRPAVLQQLHDFLLKTSAGQNTAMVLGVTQEASVKPINFQSEAASVSAAIVAGITQKTQDIITHQVTLQLINQFHGLPQNAQTEIRDAVCKP